jgi:hypothetical protein
LTISDRNYRFSNDILVSTFFFFRRQTNQFRNKTKKKLRKDVAPTIGKVAVTQNQNFLVGAESACNSLHGITARSWTAMAQQQVKIVQKMSSRQKKKKTKIKFSNLANNLSNISYINAET